MVDNIKRGNFVSIPEIAETMQNCFEDHHKKPSPEEKVMIQEAIQEMQEKGR